MRSFTPYIFLRNAARLVAALALLAGLRGGG